MQLVAKRIVDKQILKLIKMWLKAPIVVEREDGKKEYKGNEKGTPQGGVISPALYSTERERSTHQPDEPVFFPSSREKCLLRFFMLRYLFVAKPPVELLSFQKRFSLIMEMRGELPP